ncbi:MAG: mechanosensitive ion channel family protein [Bacteroidetes bacterium]|nr:mechanosensitive ion channel family protein [Bacteroidota bacterium]
MADFFQFFQDELWGARLGDYLACFLILSSTFLLKRLLAKLFVRLGAGIATKFSEGTHGAAFRNLLRKPLEWLLAVILWFYAFSFIEDPLRDIVLVHWKRKSGTESLNLDELVHLLAAFFGIVFFILLCSRTIDFIFRVKAAKARSKAEKSRVQVLPLLKDVLKILLWTLGFFWILGVVFEVNIPALVTGLGIGGVAIALAAKETIENLLASFSILADKPFAVEDTVKLGTLQGKVERIGFRSTRLRASDGTLLIVPNKKLIDEALENLSERERRIVRVQVPISRTRKPEELPELLHRIKNFVEQEASLAGSVSVSIDSFTADSLIVLVVYHLPDELPEAAVLEQAGRINAKIFEEIGSLVVTNTP